MHEWMLVMSKAAYCGLQAEQSAMLVNLSKNMEDALANVGTPGLVIMYEAQRTEQQSISFHCLEAHTQVQQDPKQP